MIQAMLASVASIQAQQTRMDVIGNDLANINTTAFKNEDVDFETLVSQQISGATAPSTSLGGTNGVSYGLGVKVGATSYNMQQGALTATSNPSDLAIQGNGYFMTSNGTATSYTRDGSFELDSQGDLVSSSTGQRLEGWTAGSDGTVDTTQSVGPTDTLKIPIGALDAAKATTSATVSGNLSSTAAPGSSNSTGTFTTTVYDSLGNAHDITVAYQPVTLDANGPVTAKSEWSWTAYSGDTTTGTPIGGSTVAGSKEPNLYFDGSGNMVTTGSFALTVPGSAPAPSTTIQLNMSGISQLGTETSVSATSQDGYPAGSLSSYAIGADGTIVGEFTNGLSQTLGQIALATFTNPAGLSSEGSNVFSVSPNSGAPLVGTANTGSVGSINSGYLEASNVDLSSSLTNLIITQRGFEANTKMVSTVDTMLQDIIDMKR